MSLLRVAFWLALIVLLLPTDAQQQARFTNFANSAMERATTFCDRNGKTCDVAAQVWAAFLKKGEFGVRLLGDLLGAGGRQGPNQPPEAAQPPPLPLPDKRAGKVAPRGTLPPSDLYHPPWRGSPRADGN